MSALGFVNRFHDTANTAKHPKKHGLNLWTFENSAKSYGRATSLGELAEWCRSVSRSGSRWRRWPIGGDAVGHGSLLLPVVCRWRCRTLFLVLVAPERIFNGFSAPKA
jgi:hypothetical protein